MKMHRRTLLMSALALTCQVAAASEKPRWPAKPAVPTDFNAEEFFVELTEKGTGVTFGNPDAPTVVRLVFDTQCPWCVWQYKQLTPFFRRVCFVWYPVAVLSPWSELQGATILASDDPARTFLRHEAAFKNEDFRGLDVRNSIAPFDKREAVWTNSKVARRAGVRTVPFGVAKTADGRYVPVVEQKTADFAKLLGLTP